MMFTTAGSLTVAGVVQAAVPVLELTESDAEDIAMLHEIIALLHNTGAVGAEEEERWKELLNRYEDKYGALPVASELVSNEDDITSIDVSYRNLEMECNSRWGKTQFDWVIGKTGGTHGVEPEWFWYCGTDNKYGVEKWKHKGRTSTAEAAMKAVIAAHKSQDG